MMKTSIAVMKSNKLVFAAVELLYMMVEYDAE